jgi:hypothetical protein
VIKRECLVLAADDNLSESKELNEDQCGQQQAKLVGDVEYRTRWLRASEQTCLEAPGAVHFWQLSLISWAFIGRTWENENSGSDESGMACNSTSILRMQASRDHTLTATRTFPASAALVAVAIAALFGPSKWEM